MVKRMVSLLVVVLLLAGCGGGSLTGNESTGSYCANIGGLTVCCTQIRPFYLGTADAPNYTTNVDANPISDCDPTQEGAQPEPFADHGAIAFFTIRPLNPDAFIPPNTSIVFERYTIDYRASTDSIGAPPIERFEGYMSLTVPAPVSGGLARDVATSIVFVDLPRKYKYYNDIVSGRYSSLGSMINNYTATVTFYGRTDTGSRFSVVGNVYFSMGAYNYCT
jgi:hypothetical protein